MHAGRGSVLALLVALTIGTLTSPAARAMPAPLPAPVTPAPAGLFQRELDRVVLVQQEHGTTAALRSLDRDIRRTPALAGVCHPIAHELGHRAAAAAGGSARRALSERDDVCGGGYTHGVIESVLGASRHPGRDLLTVCAPSNDGSCFHGVGHGLMFATHMDVDHSLRLCDLSPTAVLAGRCGEGVYMQAFSADLSAHHDSDGAHAALAQDLTAALHACERARDRYAPNCWFYAPTVFLAQHPDAYRAALTWCATAGSGAEPCTRGVGSRAVKYHPDDPAIGARACARAGALESACFIGMGSYWSVHHRGRVAPARVCDRLRGDEARRCRVALG